MTFKERQEWRNNISYEHDIDAKRHFDELLTDWKADREGLLSKIKEQDQEIEQLQRVFKRVCIEAAERQDRIQEQDREIAELRELIEDLSHGLNAYYRQRKPDIMMRIHVVLNKCLKEKGK